MTNNIRSPFPAFPNPNFHEPESARTRVRRRTLPLRPGQPVQAVPSRTNLFMAGAYGRTKLFKVSPFDEHETRQAFQTLAAQHPSQPLTMFVDPEEGLSEYFNLR